MDDSTEADSNDGALDSLQRISEVETAMAPLDAKESKFITGLIEGMDADSSAQAAGWSGRAVGARVLGRPRVKLAIVALAPYLPVKTGSRLMAPYVLERLTRIALDGSDAQSLHAARDILNMAGLGPVSRSENVSASLSDVLAALDRRRVVESDAPAVTVDSNPKGLRRSSS